MKKKKAHRVLRHTFIFFISMFGTYFYSCRQFNLLLVYVYYQITISQPLTF